MQMTARQKISLALGFLGFLGFWLQPVVTHAQFNVKVGYNAQYNGLKETNKIFSRYNENTADISQKFSKFHYIHGLELGARYMLSQRLAIDVGFISLFSTDNASSRNISGVINNDEWRITQRNLLIGFENYYNYIGFGVHIGNIKTNYLRNYPGANKKLSVYSDSYMNARVELILQAKSGNNAFALKPYYNIPITDLNIAKVDQNLNNGTTPEIIEDFSSFGVSIVFYNGPQR